MPIYEFSCAACAQKTSILSRRVGTPERQLCSFCGAEMRRLVGNFAYHHTGSIKQPAEDPRTIGLWTENKFREMGVEMPGQIRETIRRARDGELPDSMKDLRSGTPDAAYH